MAQVIQAPDHFRVPATEVENLPPTPNSRLRRQSLLLSWLFASVFLVVALLDLAGVAALLLRIGSVAGVMNGSFAFTLNFPPFLEDGKELAPGFVPVSQLAIWQSCLAAALLALRLLPGLVIWASLYRLFGAYARGEIFAPRNTHYVRSIAWAFLAYATVPLITHATLFAAQLSPIAFRLEVRQMDAAVAGVIVLAIAHVMSFGNDLKYDRDGII